MVIKAKYPTPDRRTKKVPEAYHDFNPEIDIGSRNMVLPDGRPIIVEDWFDSEMRIFCRTVWYSAVGTENWDEDQHYRYVEENRLLRAKTYPLNGAGIKRQTDASGQDVWAVTVVMARE